MIAKLIGWCIDNRFLVAIIAVIVAVIGIWATYTMSAAMPGTQKLRARCGVRTPPAHAGRRRATTITSR